MGLGAFPEYLDALESRPHDIDFAAQVPHAALRVYVMGERASRPRGGDRRRHRRDGASSPREGVEAGALGFTTSRTLNHRTQHGRADARRSTPAPTSWSASPRRIGAVGPRRAAGGHPTSSTSTPSSRSMLAAWRASRAGRCRSRSRSARRADALPARCSTLIARGQRRRACTMRGPGRAARRRPAARPAVHAAPVHDQRAPTSEIAGLPLAERVAAHARPGVQGARSSPRRPDEATAASIGGRLIDRYDRHVRARATRPTTSPARTQRSPRAADRDGPRRPRTSPTT